MRNAKFSDFYSEINLPLTEKTKDQTKKDLISTKRKFEKR